MLIGSPLVGFMGSKQIPAGAVVGVGTGSVYYSLDGINWINQGSNPGFSGTVASVASNGNGTLVATTTGGVTKYCLDGVTWTTASLPMSANYVVYENGAFYACGNGSTIFAKSTDGITWSSFGTLPSGATWRSFHWNGAKWVIVANSTSAATSTDGITWTAQTISKSGNWSRSLTWSASNSLWCIVDQGSGVGTTQAATSPDGVTWTNRTIAPGTTQEYTGLAWNGTVFCAVAGSTTAGTIAATSPTGTTWTARTLPATATWPAIIWVPSLSLFVAIGNSTNCIATSPDGATWTQRTMGGTLDALCIM